MGFDLIKQCVPREFQFKSFIRRRFSLFSLEPKKCESNF